MGRFPILNLRDVGVVVRQILVSCGAGEGLKSICPLRF